MKKLFIGLISGVAMLTGVAMAGPVNINTADAKSLAAELQGVGMAKAEAIVAWRKAHGPFESAEQLLEVDGIGKVTLQQNRSNILLKNAD